MSAAVAEPARSKLHDAALWYPSKIGWPIFPCGAWAKSPATERGLKDANSVSDFGEIFG